MLYDANRLGLDVDEEDVRGIGGMAESLSLKSMSTKLADTEAGVDEVVTGSGTVVVGVASVADGVNEEDGRIVEGDGWCGCWRCHSALRCIIRRRARCFCFLGLRLALDAGLPFGLSVAL